MTKKNLSNKSWHNTFYSEFVAAWNNATLEGITPLFKDWLLQLEFNGERMPRNIVEEIVTFATECSKPGLMDCAEQFIRDQYEMVVIKKAEGGSAK